MNTRTINIIGANQNWLTEKLTWLRANPNKINLVGLTELMTQWGINLESLMADVEITSAQLVSLLQWIRRYPEKLTPINLAAMMQRLGIFLRLDSKPFPNRLERPNFVNTLFKISSPFGAAHQYNWLSIYWLETITTDCALQWLPKLKPIVDEFNTYYRIVNRKYGAENFPERANDMLKLVCQLGWQTGVGPRWFSGRVLWGEHEWDFGLVQGEFQGMEFPQFRETDFTAPFNMTPWLTEQFRVANPPTWSWQWGKFLGRLNTVNVNAI